MRYAGLSVVAVFVAGSVARLYGLGVAAPVSVLILLLHGVNEQAGTWASIVSPLAARFRLIVPDLAGHGDSAPREGPLPMEAIPSELENPNRR